MRPRVSVGQALDRVIGVAAARTSPVRSLAMSVFDPPLLFPRAWSLLRACRAAGLKIGLVTAKSTDVAY